MKPRIPAVAWDESTGALRVELVEPGVSRSRPVRFRGLAWVEFGASGAVCAAHVHDVPVAVEEGIARFPGGEAVGHALLDTGWLWIPLTHEPGRSRRVGFADIELTLGDGDLQGLTLSLDETDAPS